MPDTTGEDGANTRVTLDDLIATRGGLPGRLAVPGTGPWAGPFRGRRRGQGMDVDDLRPYVPGDDVRHIDWKVSARLGETHTRLHREEKDITLTVVLDLRDTMFTGSRRLRAVAACLEAAARVWRCIDGGGRAALVAIDAGGITASRPGHGDAGALAACALASARCTARREALEGAGNARRASVVPSPTLPTIVDRLAVDGRRLGSVDFVTGLDEIDGDGGGGGGGGGGDARDDGAWTELGRLALIAPLNIVLIEDPMERLSLPPGRYPFAGARGAASVTLGRAAIRRIDETLLARHDALADACRRIGIRFESVRSPDPARAAPAVAVDRRGARS